MRLVIIWVALAVQLLRGIRALDYDGDACRNIVDFPLQAGTDITSVDANVGSFLKDRL